MGGSRREKKVKRTEAAELWEAPDSDSDEDDAQAFATHGGAWCCAFTYLSPNPSLQAEFVFANEDEYGPGTIVDDDDDNAVLEVAAEQARAADSLAAAMKSNDTARLRESLVAARAASVDAALLASGDARLAWLVAAEDDDQFDDDDLMSMLE